MKRVTAFLLTFSLLSIAANASIVSEQVSTDHGKVQVFIDKPDGEGPFPLLIIAPAKKYLMKERLFENLALEAKKIGFMAVRLDWVFSQKSEEPSADFKNEAHEIEAVTRHFLKRGDVKPGEVVLAAKSMGSKAAMKSSLTPYSALLLLTPNCDSSDTFEKIYSPIYSAGKPVQVTISRADPYCEIGQIYAAAKDLSSVLSLHTLEGDHNFVVEGAQNRFLNQDAAIQSSVNWLKNQLSN